MTKLKNYGSNYWRSLEALEGAPEAERFADREFQEGASELELDHVSRRRFVGILGASAALAGATTSTGCVRKPKEEIMPFAERPEDLVPGEPIFYATAYALGGTVQGLLVESQDGRPTKIEGNPKHSGSHGATSVWAQASVLDLYDPDRSQTHYKGDSEVSWNDVRSALEQTLGEAKDGAGVALVVESLVSPSLRAQIDAFVNAYPKARVFVDDPAAPEEAVAAAEAIAGPGARVRYALENVSVAFAADADVLTLEHDNTRLAREWAEGRQITDPSDPINRLYVVEPHFTNTGVMADHRRAIKAADVGAVLVAVAKQLQTEHGDAFSLPPGAEGVIDGLPSKELDPDTAKFVEVLAKDLAANAGKSAVIVGYRQPAWVHGLGLLINAALGNQGGSVQWMPAGGEVRPETLTALAKGLEEGSVTTVMCLGTNPAHHAPGSLGLPALLGKATVFHAGLYRDETARLATWHIPVSHYLEAWGDAEASDGTITIAQPLIAPLHKTYSILELVSLMATGNLIDGYSIVKGHWTQVMGEQFSDRSWRRWLHDGIVTGTPRAAELPQPVNWAKIGEGVAEAEPGAFEIDFHIDPKLYDGRFATNAWMQELPHPITKLVWDNAAYISAKTAEQLGVGNGDLLEVTVEGRSLSIPAWIAPGQADGTVSLALGYGRKQVTPVTEGVGFDVNVLRSAKNPWFASGQVAAAGGSYELVSTQDHGTMKPQKLPLIDFPERPIALEATQAEYQEKPDFVLDANMMPKDRLKHLWDPPELTGRQQWGMTIDLQTCTGCNACVIACQAENNIPVVGKEQVGMGREMHWMRIDRYYRGDVHEPTAVVQPMACQHCESAPCETVCPVNATAHSPEGLNDMAYNRCIGTRYCSNNCPYKVRRFNFFNYNLEIDPLLKMQKNPDVTVRFRGVMEKCTYCVQRIQRSKIDAHVAGEEVVADGGIVTACQQACPSQAIMFGDVADPNTKVSQLKRQSRNYGVLTDLNTHPRTTYLARIRNPHPELS